MRRLRLGAAPGIVEERAMPAGEAAAFHLLEPDDARADDLTDLLPDEAS